MSIKELQSLLEIIDKIRIICKTKYNNELHDNTIAIFNELTENERKVFINSLLDICLVVDNKQERDASDDEITETIKNEIVSTELRSIEELNSIELIKLKTWFVKAIIITLFASFIVIVGMSLVYTSEESKIVDSLSTMFEVISIMFNI